MVREGMAAMFIGSSSYFRAVAMGTGRRKLLTNWRLLRGIIGPQLVAIQMVEMDQQTNSIG